MTLAAVDKQDEYYTSEEVATLLRVSRTTLLRMVKRGDMVAPIRLSRATLRWSKKRIDAMLEVEKINAQTPVSRGDQPVGDYQPSQ